MESVNLKILLVGDSGTGKSRQVAMLKTSVSKVIVCSLHVYLFHRHSLMLRFVNDTFDPEMSATIGRECGFVGRTLFCVIGLLESVSSDLML